MPYCRKTFQSLSRGDQSYALKIDKAHKEIFAMLPRFREDLLQNENLVRGTATRTKTALTIFQF